MGVSLKNKPSSLNTIVGNAILMLILMFALASLLLIPSTLAKLSGGAMQLVEFGDKATQADIEKVMDRLSFSELVNSGSITHISKSEAQKIMSAEIDEKMLDRIATASPFRDVIQFSLAGGQKGNEKDFLAALVENPLVLGVYNSADLGGGSGALGTNYSRILTIILLLLFTIMAYIFYNTSAKALIDNNKKQLESYSLYGSEDSYLQYSLLKTQVNGVVKGWIIAVFLIFLMIYLFLGLIGLRITDISVIKLSMVVLLPLLFAIATNHILNKTKLNNYLKSL